jgi:3-oxosteroid 1-dehydrogenase
MAVNTWDEEFDLICVGSGAGGLAAAIAGHDVGLRTTVLEKTCRVGGNTVWSYGIVWAANNDFARAEGIADSIYDARAYLDYLGGTRNDPDVTASFVENATSAVRHFAANAGIPFYLVRKLPDHYYPLGKGSVPEGRSLQVRPFEASSVGAWRERLEVNPYGHGRVTFEEMSAWGGRAVPQRWDQAVIAERERRDIRTFGGALAGHFLKAALDRGISIQTGTEAIRLVVQDGRVYGLEVMSEGRSKMMGATRGVILATGLYDSNPRLMDWFDEFNPWPPVGAPRNQGSGLIMALEQGSAFAVSHWNLSMKLSYQAPGDMVDGQPFLRVAGPRELAYPHSFIVNKAGRRFADESSFGDVATKLRHFDFRSHRLMNVPCYLIFDAQYFEKYGLPPFPAGPKPPNWLPQADSIAGLAGQLGVDESGLVATADRFNGFVEGGRDTDFARGDMPWSRQAASDLNQRNPNLGSVSRPPFCGLAVHPTQGNAIGLVTDRNGQVVHLRGHPIPGLYACGEVASWRHVGVGYQAGLSLSGAITFGWLAARHAAGQPAH